MNTIINTRKGKRKKNSAYNKNGVEWKKTFGRWTQTRTKDDIEHKVTLTKTKKFVTMRCDLERLHMLFALSHTRTGNETPEQLSAIEKLSKDILTMIEKMNVQ